MILVFDGTDENVGAFIRSLIAALRERGMETSAQMIEAAWKRGEGMAAVPQAIADVAGRVAARVFNDIGKDIMEKGNCGPIDAVSPNANEGHQAARTERDARDWPGDFSHENGNYPCHCCWCFNEFTGHKRRVVCRQCVGAS
jgi:hypothetical protein